MALFRGAVNGTQGLWDRTLALAFFSRARSFMGCRFRYYVSVCRQTVEKATKRNQAACFPVNKRFRGIVLPM